MSMRNNQHRPDYRRVMKKVDELRKKHHLDTPPIDPVDVARKEGLEVRFVRFRDDYRDVAGFYVPAENAIYVNKEDAPVRQTFTIAHELAHALLHKDWAESEDYRILWRDPRRNNMDNPLEKEANAFAANLLVPRDLLDEYYDWLSVEDLSKLFAVSVPVIRNRLEFEYGIIQ